MREYEKNCKEHIFMIIKHCGVVVRALDSISGILRQGIFFVRRAV